jgi:hypothetical protein
MKYGCPTVKWVGLALASLFVVFTFLTRKAEAQNFSHITKCRSIHGIAVFINDDALEDKDDLARSTKASNGVLVSDSVLVSDGRTIKGVILFVGSGVLVSDEVWTSDGVLVSGDVLGNDSSLSLDSLAQATAQTNDDPSRILSLQIDSGIDCSNY